LAEDKIYVTYSEDVRSALAKADVNIPALVQAELDKQGVSGKVQPGSDPANAKNEDREVFLIILAAGVTASLVGSAVARVIDAVTGKKSSGKEQTSFSAGKLLKFDFSRS
jgi:hypothetical protein